MLSLAGTSPESEQPTHPHLFGTGGERSTQQAYAYRPRLPRTVRGVVLVMVSGGKVVHSGGVASHGEVANRPSRYRVAEESMNACTDASKASIEDSRWLPNWGLWSSMTT
ncbi:hypothetical protein HBI68_021910 [Parastagonospora nodorum]|nr:hypothetical protein HBH49_047950 [Parastagonospora nodorum]KAH5611139.1 hypothetical protein HBI45_058400 [Parastagonospora nodorum]KAH6182583.1 hypothetical protein HBI68_021910 [Parastagonospora nodorum]